MQIKPLRDDLLKYLKKHNLEKKFDKTKELFEKDPFYPSLNTELLEPKNKGRGQGSTLNFFNILLTPILINFRA